MRDKRLFKVTYNNQDYKHEGFIYFYLCDIQYFTGNL